jgi:hypothetical protein
VVLWLLQRLVELEEEADLPQRLVQPMQIRHLYEKLKTVPDGLDLCASVLLLLVLLTH